MSGRTAEQIEAARQMLRPLHTAGYRLFPLARGRKSPRDKGWQTRNYSSHDIIAWLEAGGNIGIALQPDDLVIDIDVRHFPAGDDPFRRLCDAVSRDLNCAPTTISGRRDGGRHLFFKKSPTLRIRGRLPDFPGIDFKSSGGLIVAPGSRHPDTGRIYIVDDITSPPIAQVQQAPDALLALLARPEPAIPAGNSAGRISNEDLALLLSALDAVAFGPGEHDRWFALMAAAHDATGGHGLPEWLDWCAGDSRYANAEDEEATSRRWHSLSAGKAGGASYRTLLRAVVDAGRRDLVAALDDGDGVADFEDHDADVTDPVDRDAPVIDLIDPNARIEDVR